MRNCLSYNFIAVKRQLLLNSSTNWRPNHGGAMLTDCSPWLAQPTFLSTQDHPEVTLLTASWTLPYQSLMNTMHHRLVRRIILWGEFSQLRFLLLK